MSTQKSKEHQQKRPIKTERQKKAEAAMMKTLVTQYAGVLSSDDLKKMKDIFDNYDTKGHGIIKASLLGKILRSLGGNPHESAVQHAIKEVDPMNLDQLKFPEYVSAVLSIPMSVIDQDILPAFQVFDTEQKGLLQVEEMMKSLTTVGEPLDEIEAKTFKKSLRIDEEGRFDYNEFFLKFTQPEKPKKKRKGKKKKKKSKGK